MGRALILLVLEPPDFYFPYLISINLFRKIKIWIFSFFI